MRRLVIGIVLAAGCGAPPVPTTNETPAVVQPSWRAGQSLSYRFDWRVTSQAQGMPGMPEGAPADAAIHLRGQVRVHVYGATEEGALLGVRWTGLDDRDVIVMGQAALDDSAGLLEHEAFVVVPDSGAARAVRFGVDAPPLFRHLMAGFLAQVDFRRPQASSAWDDLAPAANGLARVAYDQNGRVRQRTISSYQRFDGAAAERPPAVDGRATVRLDEQGLPHRVENEELVLIAADAGEDPAFSSRSSFELERLGLEQASRSRPDPRSLLDHDLFAPPDDTEARRAMHQKFAGGMTMLQLETGLISAGNGLRPSRGYMVRAAGLLGGWPELAEEVEPYIASAPDARTQEFILDVLAAGGTPQAQAVMRRGLAKLEEDPRFPEMVTRLGFVGRPTAEAGSYLLEAHDRALRAGRQRARDATVFVMGIVARRLSEAHPELAELILARIRGSLATATTSLDREAVLAGLGNAGRPEDRALILSLRDDPDAGVRARVASALRFLSDDEAGDALFEMLGDRDEFVAAAALSVIGGYRLEDSHVERDRLASLALAGTLNPYLTRNVAIVLEEQSTFEEPSALVAGTLVALAG